MNKKREVAIYEYQKDKDSHAYERVCVGNGVLHQFGINIEECGTGIASYPTAIIEMPDGSVKNVPVEMIMFNS